VSKLRVGDRFPDFVLPDSEGQPVTLASVVAPGPALLLFYKEDW
jgi:peroxiredoxin Q/BCP